MREIKPEVFTVFQLDELTPAARLNAISNLTNQLSGGWWDGSDVESIEDSILYVLAGRLRSPGWDTYGEGDFPGIDGVELVGWELDRGQSLALSGTLTRQNAPALPWTDEVYEVRLEALSRGGHTHIGVAVEDDESEQPPAVVRQMQDAVIEAMNAGLRAGNAQLKYLTSNERAEEFALANEREFTEDGQLYLG